MPSSPFARSARFAIGLCLLSIPVAECRAQTAFGFPYPSPFDPVVHAQVVAALALAAPSAILVALIKPQFEIGRGRVGKGGVVTDPAHHAEVRAGVSGWLGALADWRVIGHAESPIQGPKGNREFLIAAEHA